MATRKLRPSTSVSLVLSFVSVRFVVLPNPEGDINCTGQTTEANRDGPKAPGSTDNVTAIIQALAPGIGTGTRVGQIGNIIASNVVREGAVQKVKQMTFEA